MGEKRTKLEIYLGVGLVILAIVVAGLTAAVIVLAVNNNKSSTSSPPPATQSSSSTTQSSSSTTQSSSSPSTSQTPTVTWPPSAADPYNQPYFPGIYSSIVQQNVAQQANISAQLMGEFNPINIRDNLRWITKNLHVAGTVENNAVMHQLADQYKSYGLDVKIQEYKVLLSYPDYNNPNTIKAQQAGQADWISISNGLSEPLGPAEALNEQLDQRALVYWNAYSQNGTATGPITFANYGDPDDFALLEKNNYSVNGTIVLAKYGGGYRGDVVLAAQSRGAIGVILYHDPQDYVIGNATFPDTVFLPPSGAQRGSVMTDDGDPLTPFYPAKPYTFRSRDEPTLRNTGVLPNIPVMPIGYRDALPLFQNMNGPLVTGDFDNGDDSWIGGMNVSYRMNSGTTTFRLTVNGYTEPRSIFDVTAMMYGSDEPDQWVLFGNHVDAWTYGSIDPNSGTAIALEMARVLTTVSKRTGWRPKRTIAFCQWDAEEYGLVGSTEYVEEYLKPLEARGVALINVDNVEGNVSLSAEGVPLLYRTLVNAAKLVPTPNPNELNSGRKTLLDSWQFWNDSRPVPGDNTVPRISLPGDGSDYERFIAYAGIPVLSLSITCEPDYCFPIYHTVYEIAWTVEALKDPGFPAYTAMGRLWLEVGRNLADSLVIPFNVNDYGLMLGVYVEHLESLLLAAGFNATVADYSSVISNLDDAVSRFQTVAKSMQDLVENANSGAPITLKRAQMLNNRLLQVERSFINEFGLYTEQTSTRHVIFAKSVNDDYAGVTFAGILDPLANWQHSVQSNDADAAAHWATTTRYGISKLQYAIESAILVLTLDGY
uniref:Uncharacterized protein n=1 Tax=Plectus sambesii TaxID=2011161 RepID=A0A914XW32_9BILA